MLRYALADLYPDITDVRRIMAQVGIEDERIVLGKSSLNDWSGIIAEAEKQRKLWELLLLATREYPANEKLRSGIEDYLSRHKNGWPTYMPTAPPPGESFNLRDTIYEIHDSIKDNRRQTMEFQIDVHRRLVSLESDVTQVRKSIEGFSGFMQNTAELESRIYAEIDRRSLRVAIVVAVIAVLIFAFMIYWSGGRLAV